MLIECSSMVPKGLQCLVIVRLGLVRVYDYFVIPLNRTQQSVKEIYSNLCSFDCMMQSNLRCDSKGFLFLAGISKKF